MKNEKVCPKCTSSDLIKISGDYKFGGVGNSIKVGYALFNKGLTVLVTRYVCTVCGFTEEWIDEKSDIEKLKAWAENEKAKQELNELEHGEDNFSEKPPWDKKNLM